LYDLGDLFKEEKLVYYFYSSIYKNIKNIYLRFCMSWGSGKLYFIKFLNFKRFEKSLDDINYNELLNLMRETQVILIDVRSKQEYLENHLSGSKNIPVYELEKEIKKNNIDKSKTIVVYCQYGVRSRKAVGILKRLGFKKVYSLIYNG